MKKDVEYLVTAMPNGELNEEANFLRNYGRQGWELVSIMPPTLVTGGRYFFKRYYEGDPWYP